MKEQYLEELLLCEIAIQNNEFLTPEAAFAH